MRAKYRLHSLFLIPTHQRGSLIHQSTPPHEVISLVKSIFRSKDEVTTVCDLHGNEAQLFINTIHETMGFPELPPRLREKCLAVLCRVCSRQGLLPRALQIPMCYNRSNAPLFCGGCADVWRGEHQGSYVAVKVLRVYATADVSKIKKSFCKEVVTWGALRHPNVLSLLGIVMDDDRFAMVSEWMPNGNINHFAKAHWDVNRFELLKDVTKGLIYIHNQGMTHGDLKGVNILIDRDQHARVADFGLLTIVSDHTYFPASTTASTGGTIRWMGPELLDPEKFGLDSSRPTKESDCYALGMVIYEVLTGRAPFASLSKDYIIMRKVIEGERPERPTGAIGARFPDDLWGMLGLCWETRVENRPSTATILNCLEQVSSSWRPLAPLENEAIGDEDSREWNLSPLRTLSDLSES